MDPNFTVRIEGSHYFTSTSHRRAGITLYGCAVAARVSAADATQSSDDILQLVLPAVAIGATIGHPTETDGSRLDRQGTLPFAEGTARSLGVAYAINYGVDTKRPNGGSHSMPSGHTSISFSSAEFLRKRYGWERRLPAYGADSGVAYSRVGSDQHQPLDVLVGAGIGILSRYLFTKPYQSRNVAITADGRSMGLQVSRNW